MADSTSAPQRRQTGEAATEALIEQLNRGYTCPADAGPEWRAAFEAGVDMSLIEDSLRLTPGERLRDHQRALDFILQLEESRLANDSRS